jgi:hypothetical protein
MSIFEFLEIIFFRRTEKSSNNSDVVRCCIISADFKNQFSIFFDFFGKSGFEGLVFGHSFVLKSHKAYETSHKNYAAVKNIAAFETILLNMVRVFSWSEIISATF